MKNFLMTSNKGLNKGGKRASHVVPTDFAFSGSSHCWVNACVQESAWSLTGDWLLMRSKVFVLELIENCDGPSVSTFRINKSSFNSKVMIIIY